MARSTSPGDGRGEEEREDWMRESTGGGRRGFDREEMERRTHGREIDQRHGWERGCREWRSPEGTYGRERGYGGGGPGPYYRGMGRGEGYGVSSYGDAGGYGREERGPYGPGYGGYGGGEYGSYGGMGPGEADWYEPAGRRSMMGGGMLGRAGERSGWRTEMDVAREGRAGAFGLHTAMAYGGAAYGGAGAARRGRAWEREGALVRDVMTRDPRTLAPDATIVEASRIMREEETGILPVVSDGRVAGVITDRDIAMRVVAENRHPAETRVSEVMSEDVHVCSPDDRLAEAVHTMAEENVRRLPVVDRDDRLRGMLSMTDVAREAEMDYALQEALEQIARRRSFWSRW